MSGRIGRETVVHFNKGSNPIIEVGEDDLLDFFRFVADKHGLHDRSLQAVILQVDGKVLNSLPDIKLMVSDVPDIDMKPPSTRNSEVSVDRTIEIDEPVPYIPASALVENMTIEDFNVMCDSYRYEPDEKTDEESN